MTRSIAGSSRTRGVTRAGGGPAATPPAQRLPGSGHGRLVLRVLLLVCGLHAALAPTLGRSLVSRAEALAARLAAGAVPYVPGGAGAAFGGLVEALAQHAARWSERALPITAAAAGSGLALLVLELAVVLGWRVLASWRYRQLGGVYLHVRVPKPQNARDASPGVGIMETLVDAFAPPGAPRRTKRQPPAIVSLSLMGVPDQPCRLGIYVAARPAVRRQLVHSLRKLIQGAAPGAVIDERADPLSEAIRGGGSMVVEELRLSLGPEYPLRHPDDWGTDPLATLAAALSPRPGTVLTECQVTLMPAPGWALSSGWRARAMRQLLLLGAKQEYHLSGDPRALEAKLRDVAYLATIRLLAVASSTETENDAAAEVDELRAMMGQYAARTGNRRQSLRSHRRTTLRIQPDMVSDRHEARPRVGEPPPAAQQPRPALGNARAQAWLVRCVLIGCGCLIGGVLGAVVAPVATAWGEQLHAGSLLSPVPGAASVGDRLGDALRALATTIGALAGTAAALCTPPWRRWSTMRTVERLLGRVPRVPLLPRVLPPWALWRQGDLLTAAELSGMWHLPSAGLQSLVELLPWQVVPAPPHAFAEGRSGRIVVGDAWRRDGSMIPVGPDLESLRGGLHFTAGMGKGKTQLMCNLALQLLPYGLVALDGKGDDEGNLTMSIRTRLPLADEARVVLIDLRDAAWPMGINLFGRAAGAGASANDQALGQLMTTMARLDPESWARSHGMATYARNGMLLILEGERHPTMAHLKQALIDEGYRSQLLERVQNRDVKLYWTTTFAQETESQRGSRVALLRRLDSVLTTALTRSLVTQTASEIDFLDCVEQRRIVLFALPHRALGELSALVATLVLQVFLRDVFRRTGSAMTRTNYGLLIDELQTFINTAAPADVDVLLTQLRAFGIAAVYTHQTLAQLGAVRDTMLINAANRIVLQVDEPDASVYAARFKAHGITATDISLQHFREHQYASLVCDGMPTGPLSIRPRPWPAELPLPVEREGATDWQNALPPGRRSPTTVRIDALLKQLAWPERHATAPIDPVRFADRCVGMSEDDWTALKGRWLEHRRAERDALIADPGQIADRLVRQQWLSRLGFTVPGLVADIDYARVRRDIEGPVFSGGGARSPSVARPQRPDARTNATPAPNTPAVAPTPMADGGVPSWRQLRERADPDAAVSHVDLARSRSVFPQAQD